MKNAGPNLIEGIGRGSSVQGSLLVNVVTVHDVLCCCR